MFIPGMTIIWCKPRTGDNAYWMRMSYAPRGYSDNEQLVEIYEEDFPNQYYYQITADSELCRPAS